MTPTLDDTRSLTVYGQHGRDVRKTFMLLEVDPLTAAGFALRFNAALKVESYVELMAQWEEGEQNGEPPIDAILRTLQGADPVALHALMNELLEYVRISPDPQHPGANRPLMPNDIRELKTLGEILSGLVKLNFGSGA